MMDIGMAAVSAAELVILCLAGWLFFINRRHTYSEAAACGIIGSFMVLAGFYQAASLIGRPSAALWIEAIAVIGAIIFILKHHGTVRRGMTAATATMFRFPLASAGLICGLGYLILQGLLIPTDYGHWDALARMLILQHQNAVVTGASSLASTTPSLMALPENQVILAQLFLRNHSDFGLGLLGIAAYLTIAIATYALSRRYAWPPTAMTVTLIAFSCPRFVFGATGPGINLIPAAVAVVCLLTIYRLVESPNALDLGMLALANCFLIGDQVLWLALPCVLLLLSIVLLLRRHGVQTWTKMISHHRWKAVLVICAALFLSRLWLFPYNSIRHGMWDSPGGLATMQFNADGIQGTAANLTRYLMQSVDITSPLNDCLYWMTRVSVSNGLQQLYNTVIHPIFGDRGAATPFHLIYHATEYLAWFGPLCLLLLPIAILYGLRFAPRRLKAVLVALTGYVFLIALITAWQPANVQYFTAVYACSIFCIAFFLPPWRLTRNSRRLLRWASFLLFFYAGLFNADRPALDFSIPATEPPQTSAGTSGSIARFESRLKQARDNSIWVKSEWGKYRSQAAYRYFGDRRMDDIAGKVVRGDLLTVYYNDAAAAFPFLLHYPRAFAVSVSEIEPDRWPLEEKLQPAYILFADDHPPVPIDGKDLQVLWQAGPNASIRPGVLYKINAVRSSE